MAKKQEQKPNRVMPIKDLEQLMLWKRHIKEHGTLKEYLFFQLGLETGANPKKLAAAKWNDISLERLAFPKNQAQYYINIASTLTGPPKKLPLPDEVVETLQKLREKFPDETYLFQSNSKNFKAPLKYWGQEYISSFIGDTAKAAGIDGKVSSLTLRKSFGYHTVVNGGWTLRELQRYFGQQTSTATRKYLELTDEKINLDHLSD